MKKNILFGFVVLSLMVLTGCSQNPPIPSAIQDPSYGFKNQVTFCEAFLAPGELPLDKDNFCYKILKKAGKIQ